MRHNGVFFLHMGRRFQSTVLLIVQNHLSSRLVALLGLVFGPRSEPSGQRKCLIPSPKLDRWQCHPSLLIDSHLCQLSRFGVCCRNVDLSNKPPQKRLGGQQELRVDYIIEFDLMSILGWYRLLRNCWVAKSPRTKPTSYIYIYINKIDDGLCIPICHNPYPLANS